jgi:hypothetical protein
MTDGPLHIGIGYRDTVPEEIIDQLTRTIAHEKLDLRVEAAPADEVVAALEWLLPTAVVIFLGKAYFDAFLKEAGKDHYHLLKAGVASLWRAFFGQERALRVRILAAAGKVPDADPYSLAFSIVAEAEGGYRFKLLLEDSIDEHTFSAVTARFLDFLNAYHAAAGQVPLLEGIRDVRVVGRTILVAYDKEQGVFRVVDPVPPREKRQPGP